MDAVLRDQVSGGLTNADQIHLQELIRLTDEEKYAERESLMEDLGMTHPAVDAFHIYITRFMMGSPGTV